LVPTDRPVIAEFWSLDIEGFHAGDWRRSVQPWRRALGDMIGAEIDYQLQVRAYHPPPEAVALSRLTGRQVLEARALAGQHACPITEEMRRGLWEVTPDEPLLVLLLLDLPGCALPAKHAEKIAERLEELTPLIEVLDPTAEYGMSLMRIHEAAIRFFQAQARSGRDVPVRAEYLSAVGEFFFACNEPL